MWLVLFWAFYLDLIYLQPLDHMTSKRSSALGDVTELKDYISVVDGIKGTYATSELHHGFLCSFSFFKFIPLRTRYNNVTLPLSSVGLEFALHFFLMSSII